MYFSITFKYLSYYTCVVLNMPKEVEAGDRRVMVSVKMKYIAEAGTLGISDMGDYIDALKGICTKKEDQYLSMQKASDSADTENIKLNAFLTAKQLRDSYNAWCIEAERKD